MSIKQHTYQLIKEYQDLDPIDFIIRIFGDREMPKMNENLPFFVGKSLRIEDPFVQFILPIEKSLKFDNEKKGYILIYDFEKVVDFFDNLEANEYLDTNEYNNYFKFLDKLFEMKVKAYYDHYQYMMAEKEKERIANSQTHYDDIPF